MSDDTLLSLEDDGGRPVDTLLALAELPRAVRSTHAHLSVRQTAIAEAYRQRGGEKINYWCRSRAPPHQETEILKSSLYCLQPVNSA